MPHNLNLLHITLPDLPLLFWSLSSDLFTWWYMICLHGQWKSSMHIHSFIGRSMKVRMYVIGLGSSVHVLNRTSDGPADALRFEDTRIVSTRRRKNCIQRLRGHWEIPFANWWILSTIGKWYRSWSGLQSLAIPSLSCFVLWNWNWFVSQHSLYLSVDRLENKMEEKNTLGVHLTYQMCPLFLFAAPDIVQINILYVYVHTYVPLSRFVCLRFSFFVLKIFMRTLVFSAYCWLFLLMFLR